MGPGKCLECLGGSWRIPRGSRGKHPHVCQRAPCPAAASALLAAFPRNALPTQTHTNTPIPCAAASRGGVGEKAAASFRAGSRAPGKRFPPTETSTERARWSPWKLTGAGRKPALSRERSGTGPLRSPSGTGEKNRNLIERHRSTLHSPDPVRWSTRPGYHGNRSRCFQTERRGVLPTRLD